MKKILFVLAMVLMSVCSFGQTFSDKVFSVSTVDEFGDDAGGSNQGLIALGSFKNSVGTNTCSFIFFVWENTYHIKIMEYNKYEVDYGTYAFVFTNDKGDKLNLGRIINRNDMVRLYSMLQNSEWIKCEGTEYKSYGVGSKYYFKITQCKEFADIIKQQLKL